MCQWFKRFPSELALALLITLVHGTLYVFMVPPWRHYDEAAHFEYAALIAKYRQRPAPDLLDTELRAQMGRSMERTGFYNKLGKYPDLILPDGQHVPSIGYSQLVDSPVYYALASVPIALLRDKPIEWQVRGARLVSLGLLLITVACAWGTAVALTGPGHPLRWMLPCAVGLLPAFVDVMTSVNSDVGAVVAASAFVWVMAWLLSTRLTSRWPVVLAGVGLMCGLAGLSFWVKSSTAVIVPVAALGVLFGVCRGRWRGIAWLGLGLASALGLLLGFRFSDAALWVRDLGTVQAQPTRCDAQHCGPLPIGEHAFYLHNTAGGPAESVFQIFPPAAVAQMQGKTVSIGVQLWQPNASADAVVSATLPYISSDYAPPVVRQVGVGASPRFFVVTQTIPATASFVRIVLPPAPFAPQNLALAYDDVVVVGGDFSQMGQPVFTNTSAEDGIWGGQRFHNLVRNPSGEASWLTLYPPAAALIDRVSPAGTNWPQSLASLQDWPAFGWYLTLTLDVFLRTFWTQTGTGNIAVPDVFNTLARFMMAFGLAGSGLWLWQQRKRTNWALVLMLAALVLLAWVPSLLRGIPILLDWWVWVPVARYTFPAIIPLVLALCVGWLTVSRLVRRDTSQRYLIVGFSTFFAIIVLATFVANVSFHYGG